MILFFQYDLIDSENLNCPFTMPIKHCSYFVSSVIWNRTPPFPPSEIGVRCFFSFNTLSFVITLIARCINFTRSGVHHPQLPFPLFHFGKGRVF